MALKIASAFILDSGEWSASVCSIAKDLSHVWRKAPAIRAWGCIKVTHACPHTLFLGWFVKMACSCGVRESPERWSKAQLLLPHGTSLYVLCGLEKDLEFQKQNFHSSFVFSPPKLQSSWPTVVQIRCSLGQQENTENCPLPRWTSIPRKNLIIIIVG